MPTPRSRVVSEIGTDMTKWTSAKHFASWLGLSPNNRITGGKVISSKTKPSANRAAAALRLAANALHRSDSALAPSCAGRKRNWERPRPSPPRPTSWPGSSIPCCATVRNTWMPARNTTRANIQQRALRAAQRRAAQLGYRLVPMPDAPEHTTYAPPGAPIAS